MAFHDIINWFEKEKRHLSFRETKNPYFIWISEIMLQQTQVVTMLPYYEKFIKKYPTVKTLAEANLEDVLNTLKGIGYYRRFRLMHQCAQVIETQFQGQFPNRYEEIIKLPGIGTYTAGAIMSIAFSQPYSALDGNVMRVLTRVYQISDDIRLPKTIKKLDRLNQSLVSTTNPDIYTHAMMEIGATVCKKYQPKCEICPLQDICMSYQHSTQEQFPYKSTSQEKKVYRFKTMFIVNNQNEVLIKKETKTLFEGMYLFPQFDFESNESVLDYFASLNIDLEYIKSFPITRHVFTHQVWEMEPTLWIYKSGNIKDYNWYNLNTIDHALMPKAHSKLQVFLKDSLTF
jgi:A/G-specific adenine glycosylase